MATKGASTVDRDRQLWKLLSETYHTMWRSREKELDMAGISAIQAGVLLLVNNSQEPVTPAVLSRFLYREPHTISGLLTRMEKQGLVKRVKDLKRKNQVRIVLTEKGKKAYEKQNRAGVTNKILTTLTAEERSNFVAYLEKLKKAALKELRSQLTLPYA